MKKTQAVRVRAAKALRESARLKMELARTHGRQFMKASALLARAVRSGHKVLFFGNGGSAADAQHLASELMGRFFKERRALPALALTTDTSGLTAIPNDLGFHALFSRQVEGLARKGDVVVAISTSGASPNVLEAIRSARARGASIIGFTGAAGGEMAAGCDVAFIVPSRSTPRIQESHIAIGHILCELAEEHA